MDNLTVFNKKNCPELVDDFNNKKKYGMVYYNEKAFYVKKGLKWYYVALSDLTKIEIIASSRQLRQCCGAPIYPTKSLLLTTKDDNHIYLDVEETANGDYKCSEKLMEQINKYFN